MMYLIWKVETTSGDAIRAMPVLFSTLEQAASEADALNERFSVRQTGYTYIAKEVHPDVIRSFAHAERILDSQ